MDPTPSATHSTKMMIHGEKLGYSKSTTDSVLHGALGAMQAPSSTTADALAAAAVVFAGVIPPRVYRCMFCTNTFTSAQALGGHQNAHKRERAKIFHPSGQWPNCLAHNDRGGPYYRAPINGAAQYGWGRHSVPSYPRQAGTRLGAAQGSSGANVPAPAGYRWTGDGGHLGRQSSMRELNQEETPDGIDLTLKL